MMKKTGRWWIGGILVVALVIGVWCCPCRQPLAGSPEIFWRGAEEASLLEVSNTLVVMASLRANDVKPLKEALQSQGIEFRAYPSGQVLKHIDTDLAVCSGLNHGVEILLFCARNAYAPQGNAVVMVRLNQALEMVEERMLFMAPEGTLIDNTGVSYDGKRWVMAYQNAPFSMFTGKGGHYTVSFMESADLMHWRKVGKNIPGGHYASAPALKFMNGWWYVLYTAQTKVDGRYLLDTKMRRTRDFRRFSGERVLLEAETDHGRVCACDADLLEFQGKTYVIYHVGDQERLDSGGLKIMGVDGSSNVLMKRFF